MIACAARHGIPLKLVSAGQAGATSPAPLAGAVAQQTAEVLAGIVYVNLLNPGQPATYGALPIVSDQRTGAMAGGSAEQGLLMAACAQMARFYDIPCAVSAGMTDSKMPDFQAGYEKGYTELLSALAGANLIYEAAGMYGSLLGASLESFVLDNDMIGAIMRATRGFEVSETTLSLEVIRDVCIGGAGHFLGHAETLNRMESDYFYPALADRGRRRNGPMPMMVICLNVPASAPPKCSPHRIRCISALKLTVTFAPVFRYILTATRTLNPCTCLLSAPAPDFIAAISTVTAPIPTDH